MAHTATETSRSSASSIIRLENLCVKRSSDGTLSSTSYKLCNARIEAFLTPGLCATQVQAEDGRGGGGEKKNNSSEGFVQKKKKKNNSSEGFMQNNSQEEKRGSQLKLHLDYSRNTEKVKQQNILYHWASSQDTSNIYLARIAMGTTRSRCLMTVCSTFWYWDQCLDIDA